MVSADSLLVLLDQCLGHEVKLKVVRRPQQNATYKLESFSVGIANGRSVLWLAIFRGGSALSIELAKIIFVGVTPKEVEVKWSQNSGDTGSIIFSR